VVPNPIETDKEEAEREGEKGRCRMQQSVGQPRHCIVLREGWYCTLNTSKVMATAKTPSLNAMSRPMS
jgi:hypothetical protein